jgi:hypothetical protein
LLKYQKGRCPGRVEISVSARPIILKAFVEALVDDGRRVLVASCSDLHLHALVELPADKGRTKATVGEAKRLSSRAVKREMPGNVWGAGGAYKPVENRKHQVEAFFYILERQEEGAVVGHYRLPGPPPSRARAQGATRPKRRPG